MEYTDKTMEHFMCPQNVGSMSDSDATGSYGDPSCGDSLMMFIKVNNNIIKEISYLVFGCCASIASASMTSVLAKGKSLEEAEKISEEDVSTALGGLPEIKKHCSNIGVFALKTAIKNYKKGVNYENHITSKQ
jgi:nitrogen fixation protein NifU and related proteins